MLIASVLLILSGLQASEVEASTAFIKNMQRLINSSMGGWFSKLPSDLPKNPNVYNKFMPRTDVPKTSPFTGMQDSAESIEEINISNQTNTIHEETSSAVPATETITQAKPEDQTTTTATTTTSQNPEAPEADSFFASYRPSGTQIICGAGALAVLGGYIAYQQGWFDFIKHWFAKPAEIITIESMLKTATLEQLKEAQPEVVRFVNALGKIVHQAFDELGQGQVGQSMKSADEIFTLTINKENPLFDIMITQQTLMKNAYSELKGHIEQWQKDKKGYAPGRVPFGSLYNNDVRKTLNTAIITMNAQIKAATESAAQ